MAALLPRRAGVRTNLGLLTLLALAWATGTLAFALGEPPLAAVVVATHGAAGLGLVLLAPWKSVVVRRSWRRARRTARSTAAPRRAEVAARAPRGAHRVSWASVALAVLTVLVVASGLLLAWARYPLPGPVTGVQLHVGAALALVPLVVQHVVARPQRLARADLSRRQLLRTAALGAGAAATWGGLEVVGQATDLPGARRRFTGSDLVAIDDPATVPVTQWFTDAVPDAAGRPAVVRTPLGDLDPATLVKMSTDRVRAVLDCTGGWYAEQEWRGVRLDRLLPAGASGRAVDVVSVTGYSRRFSRDDAAGLLLATGEGDRPLSAGHGAPARLVAPGRRGFWWVKWVAEVRLTDAPVWAQPPFPLR